MLTSQRMRLLCAHTHTQSKCPKRPKQCLCFCEQHCLQLPGIWCVCLYIYTYMCVVRPKIVTLTPHFFSKFAFLTSYLRLTVHVSSWVFLKPWTSTFFAVSLSQQSHPSQKVATYILVLWAMIGQDSMHVQHTTFNQ